MKLFIFKGKSVNPKFYKETPWPVNIDVTVPDESSGDSLINYLEIIKKQASENPIITGIQILKDE